MKGVFYVFACCFTLLLLSEINAQPAKPQILSERTKGFKIFDGFVPFYWDEARGKVFLEVPTGGREFIMVNGLATGVGSNDIGLDRGQLGKTRLVYFERIGAKVLLVEKNTRYRASAQSEAEKRSVDESFAKSVLFGFPIEGEDPGKVLIDFTPFLFQDLHGLSDRLKNSGQGIYRLDESRSALYTERTKNFPMNTEFEAILTFTGSGAGSQLASVVPSTEAVTVRQHISLVALPQAGYIPLVHDARSGFFSLRFSDYSSSIAQSVQKEFTIRHRLVKKKPGEVNGEPERPIVYYLDPGVPEPVRSAVLDGARWWTKAFEIAGFKNAFRVELLPEGADPMDVRYNVIQWVHRSTRGWSYGNTVIDPRTGEIIKGHVSLGSLRVRQDYLIFQGLLSPFDKSFDSLASNPMSEASLARIRQLSAHEVGHTLGLAHNFAASVNRRASVMDYPHPLILEKDGKIDLSQAYGTEIGAWDIQAIKWGYGDFAGKPDPVAAREAVITENIQMGLRYLSDADARSGYGAHPETHQWDNGTDAVAELDRLFSIRKNALARFGEKAIREGQPMASLHEKLVPVYLMHRYQVEAAAKWIGGQSYSYSHRGDGQPGPKPVSSTDQKRALESILKTVTPEALKLPDGVLATIPPRVSGSEDRRELFNGSTGVTFDGLAPAEAMAEIVWTQLVHPARLERVLQQTALRSVSFSAENMQEMINQQVFGTSYTGASDRAVQSRVGAVLVRKLMETAASAAATPDVKGWALEWLDEIGLLLERTKSRQSNPERMRLAAWFKMEFQQFQNNPAAFQRLEKLAPPGAPIGDCQWE
jgi:hypothetical protein